ncbi:hypothetical protein AGMMS50268_40370 [Spirochaetia bacterium]|nr:hypothetical protein AGMMS50268_40370 [Spirochaetia bacterium]
MENMLKQVGMGAGAVKSYRSLAKAVNQYQIALDMAVDITFIVAGKA